MASPKRMDLVLGQRCLQEVSAIRNIHNHRHLLKIKGLWTYRRRTTKRNKHIRAIFAALSVVGNLSRKNIQSLLVMLSVGNVMRKLGCLINQKGNTNSVTTAMTYFQ